MPCREGSRALPPLREKFPKGQTFGLQWRVVCQLRRPGLHAPRGRGAASQEEAEGQTAGDQGTKESAVEGPMERGDEAKDHEEQYDDNDESPSGDESSSSSGEPSKDDK